MTAVANIKASTIIDLQTNAGPVLLTSSSTVGFDTTFAPEGFTPAGVATWRDRSSGIQVGFPTFTLGVRPPTKTSALTRVSAKLVLPVLETASGGSTPTGFIAAAAVAYNLTWTAEWLLPQRCSLAERQKLMSLALSLMASTINANDGAPSDATGSPVAAAAILLDKPY
jgi:hypothetical protein